MEFGQFSYIDQYRIQQAKTFQPNNSVDRQSSTTTDNPPIQSDRPSQAMNGKNTHFTSLNGTTFTILTFKQNVSKLINEGYIVQ
jgi:hypothetical protein